MSSSVVDIFKGKTANQIAIEHGDTGSPRKPSQSKITFEGPDLIWVKSANYKGEFSEQYKGMPMMRLSQNDFEKRFPKRTAEQYKQIRSSSVSLEAQMFEEELKTWASKLVKDESSAVVNLAMPDSEPRTPEGIARPAPTAHPVDSVAAQLTQKKQDQPSVSPRSWVDESKTAARQEDAQARREARAQAAESAREERRRQYELRQAERKQRAQEQAQALAARRAQND